MMTVERCQELDLRSRLHTDFIDIFQPEGGDVFRETGGFGKATIKPINISIKINNHM
jgi:hypothetical protein